MTMLQCNLKGVLKERNRSHKWLANKLSMSSTAIYRLSAGDTFPKGETLAAICRELACQPGDLFRHVNRLGENTLILHVDDKTMAIVEALSERWECSESGVLTRLCAEVPKMAGIKEPPRIDGMA